MEERISSIEVSKVPGIYNTISETISRTVRVAVLDETLGEESSLLLHFRKAEWSVLRNRAQRWTLVTIAMLKTLGICVVDSIPESGTAKSCRLAVAIKIWSRRYLKVG
jgi:hypothetical protein